jgi:hypothetical protein
MQFISEILSAIARTLFKLALLIVGVVVTLVLLCVGAVVLLWVLLKALVTGRKPVFVTTFTSFRQFQHGVWTRGAPGAGENAATGEIIEGQAVEVRHDTALPHQAAPKQNNNPGGEP